MQLVVLEGEVVGHVKGSEKRDYIVDPLGSVVAYLNSSQTLTDQFKYWPYGEFVAEIEEGTAPFLWVGSLGYFRDSDLRTYIRARTYRQDLGSWMQLDPLWPKTDALVYADCNPSTDGDYSGLVPDRCLEQAYFLAGPSGRKSKASRFRDCQDGLERAHDWATANSQWTSWCPGGKRQICEACAKVSGLPIDCSVHPCNQKQGGGGSGYNDWWMVGAIEFPFGTLYKPKGSCQKVCLEVAGTVGDGIVTTITKQTCKKLCDHIRSDRNGCDNLLGKCGIYEKEHYRKNLCITFYRGVCFGQ